MLLCIPESASSMHVLEHLFCHLMIADVSTRRAERLHCHASSVSYSHKGDKVSTCVAVPTHYDLYDCLLK